MINDKFRRIPYTVNSVAKDINDHFRAWWLKYIPQVLTGRNSTFWYMVYFFFFLRILEEIEVISVCSINVLGYITNEVLFDYHSS
jgi:hypothetical protein